MANEFRYGLDQNGVRHPVCDDTRVDWASYAITGVHNELLNTATSSGIYTVNADKSVTANGTASGNADLVIGKYLLKAGRKVKLSGCPSGGGASKYFIYPTGKGTSDWMDTGSGVVFPVGNSDEELEIRSRVVSGQTVSNIVFKPMITDVADTVSDYTPYAMTNRELTFVEKTYTGTTDANGVIASSLPFNSKRFGLYAVVGTNEGTAYVLQRPYGNNLTAFYCTIGTAVTANKDVTIRYFEYVS